MKEIYLLRRTLGKWNVRTPLREPKWPYHTLVSDEDYDWLMQWQWWFQQGSEYVRAYDDNRIIALHRTIAHRHDPRVNEAELIAHHIDARKNNNQHNNLCWVTYAEHARLHRVDLANARRAQARRIASASSLFLPDDEPVWLPFSIAIKGFPQD